MISVFGKRVVVAVDIVKSEIRFAIVAAGRGTSKLINLSRLPLTRDGQQERELDIEQRLRDFIAANDLKGATFVICVPTSACTIKRLRLPPTTGGVLEKAVLLEAESQIAVPMDEVEFDFSITEVGDEYADVLIGACRKSFVRSCLIPVERAGCKSNFALPAAFGLWSAIQKDADSPIAGIDVRERTTDIVIGSGDHPRIARSITIGIDDLFEAKANELNISIEEAQSRQADEGVEVTGAQSASWLDRLSDELKRTLQIYERENENGRVGRLFIAGSGSLTKNLSEELSTRLNVDVERLNPMRVIESDKGYEPNELSLMAAAVGTAVDVADGTPIIDFTPQNDDVSELARKVWTYAPIALAALIALELVAFGFFHVQGTSLKGRLGDWEDTLSRSRQSLRDVAGVRDMPKRVEEMEDLVARVHDSRADWLEFLKVLSQRLPASVWLNEISCAKNRAVVLRGSALSHSAVADATRSMRRLAVPKNGSAVRLFADVRADYANTVERSDKAVVDFQLTCLPMEGSMGQETKTKQRTPRERQR